jgi:hypothetical protein
VEGERIMRVAISELEYQVGELNRLFGGPEERFVGEGRECKEQVGHYYLKYNDKGLILAKVISRDGKSLTLYQSTFGKEDTLKMYLKLLIDGKGGV